MKQLIILVIVVVAAIMGYLYFAEPDKFKEVVDKTKDAAVPDLEMDSNMHYKRGDSRFSANDYEGAIADFKKAMKKDMKETGKDKPDALKAAHAMYKVSKAYDQMARHDSANPKKGEWEQQAANWSKRFLKYYDGHEYTNKAERRLQSLEATGIKASAELAN